MSKHQKALDRLLTTPPPSDYTWDELVSVLGHFGYKVHSKSGSHRRFKNDITEDTIFCAEPHPRTVMKRYAVREVAEKLRELGLV